MFKNMEKVMLHPVMFITFTAVVFLFGACAKGNQSISESMPIEDGQIVRYEKEVFTLSADNVDIARFSPSGICFLESRAGADNFVKQSIKYTQFADSDMGMVSTENHILENIGGGTSILQFFTDDTGLYTVCGFADSKGAKGLVLSKYDSDGKLLLSGNIAVSNLNNPDAINLVKTESIQENTKLYLKVADELVILDEDNSFKETGRLAVAKTGDIIGDGERVWCIENRANGVSIYDVENKKDTADFDLNYICASCVGQFLYLSDGIALYQIDTRSYVCHRILRWAEYGINGQNVTEFFVSDSVSMDAVGTIAGIEQDGDQVTVFFLRESENAEEDTITLRIATSNPHDPILQKYISGFVNTNPQYRMEIIDLAEGEDYVSLQDAMLRLNKVLISDTPPDIVDMYTVAWKNYADKNVFEDLYDYLDESDEFDKSFFLENILKNYETDGKLTAIPNCFYISGYVAKEKNVGNQPVWTVDEILKILEAHNDMALMEGSPYACMNYLVAMSKDVFMDEENRKCNFDSEEFKKILECAKNYSLPFDSAADANEMFMQDHILIQNVSVNSILDMQFQNQMYKEKLEFVGNPTQSGTPGIAMQGFGAYGICTVSAQKEDAWKFVKFVLSSKIEVGTYLPSRKDYLDGMLEIAGTAEYETDEKGQYVYGDEGERVQIPKGSLQYQTSRGEKYQLTVYAATEEELEQLNECIQYARLQDYDDWEIDYIIREEAEAYFAGHKSVDEVVEIIQNRVQNYLYEQ